MAGSLILVINAGSSSLKYQVVEPHTGEVQAKGIIERIGDGGPSDHGDALRQAFGDIAAAGVALDDIAAVGHRVVHGGKDFTGATLIDDAVLATMKRVSALAPLHNPPNLLGVGAARELLPQVPQVAVFDTGFFTDLPDDAATYAVDTAVAAELALRRYGFHGTSHRYVAGEVARILGREDLKLIVAHLGNGASVTAIDSGTAVDTSMGYTPLEGLVMGTRGGDIDPGAVIALLRRGRTLDEVDELLNKRSGLKGLTGETDFRAVVERKDSGDAAADLAYRIVVRRLRKYLGGYAAELGGVDAIAFTAGIGEHSPALRADVTASLGFLGVTIDPDRNAANDIVISTDDSPVTVLVVPTNEELAIARDTAAVIGL